ALGQVEQQGQCGRPLAAGAQHVGGADIARADPPDVAQAGEPGHQQTGRDRAQQVTNNRSGEQGQRRALRSLILHVLREKTANKSGTKLIKALSIIYLFRSLNAARWAPEGDLDGAKDAAGNASHASLGIDPVTQGSPRSWRHDGEVS